jgi:hypothetical protein
VERDLELLSEAIRTEGDAQRALLAGEEAAVGFLAASALYRASWEAAAPDAFGRLVGMIKAAVIAGDAAEAAAYVLEQIPDERVSPVAAYAHAIASMVRGDDGTASWSAREMLGGGEAFAAPAAAIEALAIRSRPRYGKALATIVADFEGRDAHLTGVAIADTAVMLERLASRRGMDVRPVSATLPG